MSEVPSDKATARRITDPARFFRDLGELHDARVLNFLWCDQTVRIGVDDLYSAFDGLPEYPTRQGASLIFEEVQHLRLDLECNGGLAIFGIDASLDEATALILVRIDLSPGGRVELACRRVSGNFDPEDAVSRIQ